MQTVYSFYTLFMVDKALSNLGNNYIFNSGDSHFFHICSDGNKLDWLFKDDADFIAGVNRIAICMSCLNAEIYSYILMDNHIHILLYGSSSICKEFINKYKLLTGKWARDKYGYAELANDFIVQSIKINSLEHLLNVLAYIDRNIINTNYPYLASEYQWGSAKYLFKERGSIDRKFLSDLSIKEKKLTLHTHMILPDTWSILPNGMICPDCFVSYEKVENLFQTSRRYLFYLSKKVEGTVESEMLYGARNYIVDKELRVIAKELVKKLYGEDDYKLLDIGSRLQLAKKLKYDYLATTKQISRVIGVSIEILSSYI